jgi:lysophospholipase L1-like esterase
MIKRGKHRLLESTRAGPRTAWPDPFKNGRDGSQGLSELIETCSPLKLVILMLGTNDYQCTHDNNAWMSAQGTAKLAQIIRQSPIEPGMPAPEIMIVVPPKIIEPKGVIANKFQGAETRCVDQSIELKKIAEALSTMFFETASVTDASTVDGIHLDEDQHRLLGEAISRDVLERKIF